MAWIYGIKLPYYWDRVCSRRVGNDIAILIAHRVVDNGEALSELHESARAVYRAWRRLSHEVDVHIRGHGVLHDADVRENTNVCADICEREQSRS